MIGKAKSISHTAIAIEYARTKSDAIEIHRNGVGGTNGDSIATDFKMTQHSNPNCKNNTLAIILSPTIQDGQNMALMDFREINDAYLERMGMDSRQSISYLHNDVAHRHLHIYVNRIDVRGQAYSDSFIGAHTGKMAREIATEREMTVGNQAKKELEEAQMQQMQKDIQSVLKTKPTSMEALQGRLWEYDIELKEHKNKKGELRGHRLERVGEQGAIFKASKVAPELTPKRIYDTLSYGIVGLSRQAAYANSNALDYER